MQNYTVNFSSSCSHILVTILYQLHIILVAAVSILTLHHTREKKLPDFSLLTHRVKILGHMR